MLNAIIVEDEEHCSEHLIHLLSAHDDKILILSICIDVASAQVAIEKHEPDLLFLDVNLGEDTSFDLLAKLDTSKFQIIFTTAFDHYAIRAFQFNAIHYLLKPVIKEELKEALTRVEEMPIPMEHRIDANKAVVESLEENTGIPKSIRINSTQGFDIVEIADLLYLTAEGSLTHFHTNTEKSRISSSYNLKQYEYLLEDSRFFKSHRSHIVNMSSIVSFDGKNVHMLNGYQLPVSERKKSKFKKELDQYLSDTS